MISEEALWIAGGIAALGAYGFWSGFRALAKCRTVENTPTARIRSTAQGYTGISGLACAPPRTTIRGPLTGKPCVWWHYQIEENGFGRSGDVIDEQTSEVPFLLDDSTGQCLVDPRGADVTPHGKIVWYGATQWPEFRLPPAGGLLGKLFDALMPGGRYRYIERRLEAGMPVNALGEFRSRGGISAADPEDGIAQVLHEWKADQAGLLDRFDRNHDGRLDAAEWDQVRAAARDEVLQKRRAMELEPMVPTLAQPGDGRAYVLSGADPGALARRCRWQALAGIALFVGSVAALAAFLSAVA
jgi:hypothetical protein